MKRQWEDPGQFDDLRAAAEFYRRGALGDLGDDAYAHINSAFLEDVLASRGDETAVRQIRAAESAERIVTHVPPETTDWWPAASRAEALLGLGRYAEALQTLQHATRPAEPWKLQTTARQLAVVARLREREPLNIPRSKAFSKLWCRAWRPRCPPGCGRVGLALSGGGLPRVLLSPRRSRPPGRTRRAPSRGSPFVRLGRQHRGRLLLAVLAT